MTNAFDKMSDKLTHSSTHSNQSNTNEVRVSEVSASAAAVMQSDNLNGGEFEESIKFAKQIKKALNKVFIQNKLRCVHVHHTRITTIHVHT